MDQFKDMDKREIVEAARNHLETVIALLISLDQRRKSDTILEQITKNSINNCDKLTAYMALLGPASVKTDGKVIPFRKGF